MLIVLKIVQTKTVSHLFREKTLKGESLSWLSDGSTLSRTGLKNGDSFHRASPIKTAINNDEIRPAPAAEDHDLSSWPANPLAALSI